MIEQHLDEWEVSTNEIAGGVSASKKEVTKTLEKLRKKGLMYKGKHGYALLDPLVFLTKKDYSRARRITKNDNLLFGGYQTPYKVDASFILGQTSLGIIGGIILLLTHFEVFNLHNLLATVFNVTPIVAALFILGCLIILGDVINNFVKFYVRERYSVLIGEKSGISYDLSTTDELSGRIERHAIKDVDINVSLAQKIVNLFGAVPVGDIRVWKEGQKDPIVFKSLPYPREVFYVIRGIQLGALEWRKKHAKDISYWKSGAKHTF